MVFIYVPDYCKYENSEDMREIMSCDFGIWILGDFPDYSEVRLICAIADYAYFAVRKNGNIRLQKSKMKIRNAELLSGLSKYNIADTCIFGDCGLVLTECKYLFVFGNNNYNKLGAGNCDFADCVSYDKKNILMFEYLEFWDKSGYLVTYDGNKLYASGYSDIFQGNYVDDNRKHVPYLAMCGFDNSQVDYLYVSEFGIYIFANNINKYLTYEKINNRVYENLLCADLV